MSKSAKGKSVKRPKDIDFWGRYFAEGYGLGSELTEHQVVRHFMFRLLRRRCGDLTKELEELVYALPDDRLYELADDFFDFSSLNDLRKWLRTRLEADPKLRVYMKPHSLSFLGYL